MNDQQYHQLTGAQINDQGVWTALTARPLFFILNMAVGGNWVSSISFLNAAEGRSR